MTIIGEVSDAISLVAKAIESTRTILDAVNDGRKYLDKYHPDAYPDLVVMLNEMSKTLDGVAKVSGVIIGFQFTVEGPGREGEPARFNGYVLEKEREINELRKNRSALKGSCTKIRNHRKALDDRAGEQWTGWALFLGKKRVQQRMKLSSALSDLYADDRRIIELIEQLMAAVDGALHDVRATLGSGSSSEAYPENVPKAAALLTKYEARFTQLRTECLDLADSLREAVGSIGRGQER